MDLCGLNSSDYFIIYMILNVKFGSLYIAFKISVGSSAYKIVTKKKHFALIDTYMTIVLKLPFEVYRMQWILETIDFDCRRCR